MDSRVPMRWSAAADAHRMLLQAAGFVAFALLAVGTRSGYWQAMLALVIAGVGVSMARLRCRPLQPWTRVSSS